MFADDPELVQYFDVDIVEGEHKASYNEAPSQMIRSVQVSREDDSAKAAQKLESETAADADAERRILDLKQWGLVPFWAKGNFKPLINARAETVTERPSFRQAVSKRRSLIPTNGYYEWQTNPDGTKQPYFLSLAGPDGQPAPAGREPVLAMAGIYEFPSKVAREQFMAEGGSEEEAWNLPQTAALLTREATDTLGEIHPRMPLFIPRDLWDLWLDPEFEDRDELQKIIDSITTPPIVPRPVAKAVGNVRNNYPGLLDTVKLEVPAQEPPALPGL